MLVQKENERARQPHPVDVHVGGRVRLRRVFLGYSQEKLANALGLTFQQIQKYERGANRISASKLFELARFLEVPVTYFFEGVETGDTGSGQFQRVEQAGNSGLGEGEDAIDNDASPRSRVYSSDPDFMSQRETLQLISSYYRIPDPKVRAEMLSLMKTLGRSDD